MRKNLRKDIKIGLVLESLKKNDAIGNNFIKRKEILEKIGFTACPILGYTDYLEYNDGIIPKPLSEVLTLKSLTKLCSGPKKYLVKMISYINSILKKNKIPDCDIYIIDFCNYSRLMERVLKTKKGLKIVDFHDITSAKFLDDQLLIAELSKAMGQVKLLKNAGIVLTHSKFVQNKIKKIGNGKKYIAPLAIFPCIPDRKQKKLNGKNKLKILFVGRIIKHKGIHILIEALSRLAIPFECSIVGNYSSYSSKKYFKKLKEQALASKLDKKLRFLRGLGDKELKLEYKKADLFVTASFHEGFCVPIVEAMSFGIPVIGSGSSAIPSTIGEGGICFKTGSPTGLKNKITQLFYDKKKYSRLSRKALAESKKYTDSNYLKFYKKLLQNYL